MSVGCGACIGGSSNVGANGIECGALMLGCSLVVCVSFYTIASPYALRAQGGWRSVIVSCDMATVRVVSSSAPPIRPV
jgi:hypothetical protein